MDHAGASRLTHRAGEPDQPQRGVASFSTALSNANARLALTDSPIAVLNPAGVNALRSLGGNGQHGRPGERLEVALRVRVDQGQRPAENAVVEFAVLNRVFNGTLLDQNTGGNLLASAGLVSGDPWPGGTARHAVRVHTDDAGDLRSRRSRFPDSPLVASPCHPRHFPNYESTVVRIRELSRSFGPSQEPRGDGLDDRQQPRPPAGPGR